MKILHSVLKLMKKPVRQLFPVWVSFILKLLLTDLMREFKVEANVGKPQVAYRETITKKVKVEGKFVRQSGGRGQYGHVWLEVEPQEAGKGYEFVDAIKGGVVPREYIPAVDKGIKEALIMVYLPDSRLLMSKLPD